MSATTGRGDGFFQPASDARVKAKICGITTADDAEAIGLHAAVDAGLDELVDHGVHVVDGGVLEQHVAPRDGCGDRLWRLRQQQRQCRRSDGCHR